MTTASAAVTGAMYIAGDAVVGDAGAFRAVDPADGAALEPEFQFADGKLVARAVELAEAAFEPFRAAPVEQRARLLELAADEIDAVTEAAAERAHRETGLPLPRLTGEVGRTTGQLRLFAAALREGSWNGARIDHALPDRKPARRPDVRQRRVPVGPVAVFAASNFPLAFSVAGGDTASALAAGLPGGGQGARRPPGHLGDRRGRGHPRGRRQRAPGRGVLDGLRRRPDRRGRARHPSGHRRGRLHRLAPGRALPRRRGGVAAGADPRLRRDERRQPGLPAAGAAVGGGGRARRGVRRVADARRGPVLHQPGHRHRHRRPRPRPLHRGGPRRRRRQPGRPDADRPDRRRLRRRRDQAGRASRDRGDRAGGRPRPRGRPCELGLRGAGGHHRRRVPGRAGAARRGVRRQRGHRPRRRPEPAARRRAGDGGAAQRHRARHRRGRAAGGRPAAGARAAGGPDPVQRLADRGRGGALDGARRPVPGHLRRPHDIGRHAGDGPLPAAGGLPGRARLPAAGRGPRVQPGRAAPPGRRRLRRD